MYWTAWLKYLVCRCLPDCQRCLGNCARFLAAKYSPATGKQVSFSVCSSFWSDPQRMSQATRKSGLRYLEQTTGFAWFGMYLCTMSCLAAAVVSEVLRLRSAFWTRVAHVDGSLRACPPAHEYVCARWFGMAWVWSRICVLEYWLSQVSKRPRHNVREMNTSFSRCAARCWKDSPHTMLNGTDY